MASSNYNFYAIRPSIMMKSSIHSCARRLGRLMPEAGPCCGTRVRHANNEIIMLAQRVLAGENLNNNETMSNNSKNEVNIHIIVSPHIRAHAHFVKSRGDGGISVHIETLRLLLWAVRPAIYGDDSSK